MKRSHLNVLEGAARALCLWRSAPPDCITVPGAMARAELEGITVHDAIARGFWELQVGRAFIVSLTVSGYSFALLFINDQRNWLPITFAFIPNLTYIAVVLLHKRIAKNVA